LTAPPFKNGGALLAMMITNLRLDILFADLHNQLISVFADNLPMSGSIAA
jgi:hypothetical protein